MAVTAASSTAAANWFPGDDNAPELAASTTESSLTFGDLIDALNPLQHIPLLSSVYRAVTGDEIGTAARAIGAAVYGGPVGLLASGVGMAIEEAMGGDPVVALANAAMGNDAEPRDGTLLAEATVPDPETAPAADATAPAAGPFAAPASAPALAPVSLLRERPAAVPMAPEPSAAAAGPAAPTPLMPAGLAVHAEAGSPSETRPRPSLADAHTLSLALLEERERTDVRADAAADVAPGTGAGGVPAWFPTVMEEALARYAASARLDRREDDSRTN